MAVVWHAHRVDKVQRAKLLQQKPCVLWFTGLSGSGKSTIAGLVEERLFQNGHLTYLLDGDNIRHGLCSDLGFSEVDRRENIRRIGEVCKLFVDSGMIVLSAFISPFQSERGLVRNLVDAGEMIEIYVNTPLEECERRDVKGLYQKARAGEIKQFTGIDSPYEAPINPEIILDGTQPLEECVEMIIRFLKEGGWISM